MLLLQNVMSHHFGEIYSFNDYFLHIIINLYLTNIMTSMLTKETTWGSSPSARWRTTTGVGGLDKCISRGVMRAPCAVTWSDYESSIIASRLRLGWIDPIWDFHRIFWSNRDDSQLIDLRFVLYSSWASIQEIYRLCFGKVRISCLVPRS